MNSSSASKYSGIVNGGGTCYLNSALQAMFHIPKFRKLVYETHIGDEGVAASSPASNAVTTPTSTAPQSSPVAAAVPPRKSKTDREILLALQKVFVAIEKKGNSASTSELTRAFGWSDSDRYHQHDAHEFVQKLLESLEKIMKGTPQEKDISDLFGYKFLRYTRCLDDGVVVRRPTDLTAALELVVEGFSTLEESLKNFVKPTPLDDKYKRDEADGSVTEHPAENGEALLSTPPVLVIHPIRVTYNPTTYARVMVPNEWRFPEVLDISTALNSSYDSQANSGNSEERATESDKPNETDESNTEAADEDEKTKGEDETRKTKNDKTAITKDPKMSYVLRSVVVHSGYATGGHYYSFVRFSPTDWVEFNDTMVVASSKASMERVAFSSSASVATRATLLVYIRSDMLQEVLCPVQPLSIEAIEERTLSLPRTVHYLVPDRSKQDGPATFIDTLLSSQSLGSLPNVTLPRGATVADLVAFINESVADSGKTERVGTQNIVLILNDIIKRVFTTVQLTDRLAFTEKPHFYLFSDGLTQNDGEKNVKEENADDNVAAKGQPIKPASGISSFPVASSEGNVFLVLAVIPTNEDDDDSKLRYIGSFSTEEATVAELQKISPIVNKWNFGYLQCYSNKVTLFTSVRHGYITAAWPATMSDKDAQMVYNDRIPGSVELVVLDAAMRPCRRLEKLKLKRRMKFSAVQKLAHHAMSAVYGGVDDVSHCGDKRARSTGEEGNEEPTVKEKKTELQLTRSGERKEKKAMPSASRITFYNADMIFADAPKRLIVPMRQAAVKAQLRDTTNGKETKSPTIPSECNAESFLTSPAGAGWVSRFYCSFLPCGAPSLSQIADDKCVEVAVRLSYQYTRRCFIATETSLDLTFPSSPSTTTSASTGMARSPVSPRTLARRTATASTLRSLIEEAWNQLKDEVDPPLRACIEKRLDKSLAAVRDDKTLERRPGTTGTTTTYTRGAHTSPSFDPVFRLLKLDSIGSDCTTVSVNWCNQLPVLLTGTLYVLDLLPETITSINWPEIALKSTISDASFANKPSLQTTTTNSTSSVSHKGASGFGSRIVNTVGSASFANIIPTATPSFTSNSTISTTATTTNPITVTSTLSDKAKGDPKVGSVGDDLEPTMMATTAPPAGVNDTALNSSESDNTTTSLSPPKEKFVSCPHYYWVTVRHIDRAQHDMIFDIPFTAIVKLQDDTTGQEVLHSLLTQLGLKDTDKDATEEWNSTLPFSATSATSANDYRFVPSHSEAMDSWKLVIKEDYTFSTWPLEKPVSDMKKLNLKANECVALLLDHAGPAKKKETASTSSKTTSWGRNRETGIKIMNIDT